MRETNLMKSEREQERDPYKRRFVVSGWNVRVSVCDVPKLFRRLPEFNGWTKDRHLRLSHEYATLARMTDQMWAALCTMMVNTYGDGNGVLISGVYRDHFPETVKSDLRHLAHTATDYWAKSSAHWQAAGKHLQTWREMRDRLIT